MITTKTLTMGERFKLWRRRRKINQFEAAAEFEVSRYEYRLWETDDAYASRPPHLPKLGSLTAGEKATVHRLRDGRSMNQIAEEVGCSEYWLRLMETDVAPTARLTEFWEDNLL